MLNCLQVINLTHQMKQPFASSLCLTNRLKKMLQKYELLNTFKHADMAKQLIFHYLENKTIYQHQISQKNHQQIQLFLLVEDIKELDKLFPHNTTSFIKALIFNRFNHPQKQPNQRKWWQWFRRFMKKVLKCFQRNESSFQELRKQIEGFSQQFRNIEQNYPLYLDQIRMNLSYTMKEFGNTHIIKHELYTLKTYQNINQVPNKCFGCLKYLVKGQPLQKNNQTPVKTNQSQAENIDSQIIELVRIGGGFLFMYCTESQCFIKPIGKYMNQNEQLLEKKRLREIINRLKHRSHLKFQAEIHFVLVKEEDLDQSQPRNYCCRLKIYRPHKKFSSLSKPAKIMLYKYRTNFTHQFCQQPQERFTLQQCKFVILIDCQQRELSIIHSYFEKKQIPAAIRRLKGKKWEFFSNKYLLFTNLVFEELRGIINEHIPLLRNFNFSPIVVTKQLQVEAKTDQIMKIFRELKQQIVFNFPFDQKIKCFKVKVQSNSVYFKYVFQGKRQKLMLYAKQWLRLMGFDIKMAICRYSEQELEEFGIEPPAALKKQSG